MSVYKPATEPSYLVVVFMPLQRLLGHSVEKHLERRTLDRQERREVLSDVDFKQVTKTGSQCCPYKLLATQVRGQTSSSKARVSFPRRPRDMGFLIYCVTSILFNCMPNYNFDSRGISEPAKGWVRQICTRRLNIIKSPLYHDWYRWHSCRNDLTSMAGAVVIT